MDMATLKIIVNLAQDVGSEKLIKIIKYLKRRKLDNLTPEKWDRLLQDIRSLIRNNPDQYYI